MKRISGPSVHTLDEMKVINRLNPQKDVSLETIWKEYVSRFVSVYGLPEAMLFVDVFKTVKSGRIEIPYQKNILRIDIRSFSIFDLYKRHVYRAEYNPCDSKTLVNICNQPIKIGCLNQNNEFLMLTVSHRLALNMLDAYNSFIEEFIDVSNMIQEEIAALPNQFDKTNQQYLSLMEKLRPEEQNPFYFLP